MSVLSIVLSLVFLLSSCSGEAGTGTMRILLHTGSSKTIAPESSLNTITKYTVEGTGPGGKTFAVDSTSSSVVLEGLPMGHWELGATGYSTKGKELARGQTEIEFTSEQDSVPISMYTLEGTGSIQVRFEWDKDLTNVMIAVNVGGTRETLKPQRGLSYLTWTSPQLEMGSHILYANLYNNSEKVCGVAEAVTILPNERTSAKLYMTSDGEWESSLKSADGVVSAYLSGISESMASNTEHSVSLIPTSNTGASNAYTVRFFLDAEPLGEEQVLMGSGNETRFTPSMGLHILSAIVTAPDGKMESASFKFTSKPEGVQGLAVLNRTMAPDGKQVLVCPVGEDRYLSADPELGILRLFRFSNGVMYILDTVQANESGWEWLGDINGLWGNAGVNYAAAADEGQNLNILRITDDNRIQKALNGEDPERIEKDLDIPLMQLKELTMASCAPSDGGGGYFFLSPQGYGRALIEVTDEYGVKLRNAMDKPTGITALSVLEGNNSLVVCAGSTGGKLYYSTFDGIGRTSTWIELDTGFSRITTARFLTETMLLVSDGNSVLLFIYKDGTWRERKTISTAALDIQAAPSGPCFYVLEAPDSITTYRTTGTAIEKLGTAALPFEVCSLAMGNSTLLAVSEDGRFALLEIIGEE